MNKTKDKLTNTIKVLKQEIEVLTTRLKPHATGYIYTAIDVINGRIDELEKTFKEYGDKGNYEHSKYYYDRERNRPVETVREMTVSEQMQEELEPLP